MLTMFEGDIDRGWTVHYNGFLLSSLTEAEIKKYFVCR